MEIAERVAARYALTRRAGIFEAPPAMMKSVGGWVAAVYAGHILGMIGPLLANKQDRGAVLDQQLREMKQSLASCEQDIKKLKPGKILRYQLWDDRPRFVGIRRRSDYWWDPQRGQKIWTNAPDDHYEPLFEVGYGAKKIDFVYSMGGLRLDEAVNSVRGALTRGVDLVEKARTSLAPTTRRPEDRVRIVELVRIQKECLKYTTVAKTYTARAARKFPVDVTGWKYLRSNSPIIKRVNDQITAENVAIDEQLKVARETFALATKAWELAQGNPDWESDPKIDEILHRLSGEWLKNWPKRPVWDDYAARSAIYQNTRPDGPKVWVRSTGGAIVAPISELEKTRSDLLGPDDVIRALAKDNWDEIFVQLDFKGHKKTLGTWSSIDRTLVVDVRGGRPGSVEAFNDNLADILRTTRHELQHLGQDLLTRIQALHSEAGTPSQDIRVPQPKKVKYKRKEHALREEEFYTRLADEIDAFVRLSTTWPVSYWPHRFQSWVNHRSEFFTKLKESEPLKWQKAVKEFAKGLSQRGVEVT